MYVYLMKKRPMIIIIYYYYYYIPGFLGTGLAKIPTHSTTWQFKTITLIQRPIKSLYLTPGSKLMVHIEAFQRLQI